MMKLNNGLLHAMQLAGGSTPLAKQLKMKKTQLSFILHHFDGYCPGYVKQRIMDNYFVGEDEFNYFTKKSGTKYITKSWLEKTLLLKKKENKNE